jgi:hypothetical protein
MDKYFKCIKGNIPVLITVPHGGSLVLDDVPNRDFGSYKKDRNTLLVAKEIVAVFETKGLKPYVVILELHRRKIDVNRGSKEGAQNVEMLKVYKQYHSAIKDFRRQIQKKYGYCLLIDLHGQKERRGFVELGYGLKKEHLEALDDLKADELEKYSSLRHLLKDSSAKEIIFGEKSFGTILTKRGYEVFPGSNHHFLKEAHFNGVYTLHRHVINRSRERIFGFNLELSFEGIRDTALNRERFSKALVDSIIEYLKVNLGKNQGWLKK